NWLESLLEHALRPSIGVVGAMLLYPDNRVQHAGVVLSWNPGPEHEHRFSPGTAPGYGNRLATVRNVSAVTGACMMLRKDVFQTVGGFDESFVVSCNDTAICHQVRKHGYLVVWTPYARLYHYESVSRGYHENLDAEFKLYTEKWGELFQKPDPYFSPHLV